MPKLKSCGFSKPTPDSALRRRSPILSSHIFSFLPTVLSYCTVHGKNQVSLFSMQDTFLCWDWELLAGVGKMFMESLLLLRSVLLEKLSGECNEATGTRPGLPFAHL